MNGTINRRDFIRYSLFSLINLSFRTLPLQFRPDDYDCKPLGIARVTTSAISAYEEPRFTSQRLGTYQRDEIILLIKKVLSPHGPSHNRRWYQTMDGFVHSGYLQRVHPRINQIATWIPSRGRLGEITTASLQSMYKTRKGDWFPRYPLYYGSQHWITGIETGPHPPQPWYQITDDLLRVKHYVPAIYVRLLSKDELKPLSPGVPPEEKWIQVSLESQTMTAYEAGKPVFQTTVSTGKESEGKTSPGEIPTDTPTGRFHIGNKMPSRHMGEGEVTSIAVDYELIGVPWVCYFHETGVAFHGTYWHDNFGLKLSHGCVNLRIEDARWIYRWSTPTLDPDEWYRIELGTTVDIL